MNILRTDFYSSIHPFVSDIHIDVLGNIIAHKKGEGKRLMFIAHHDVVCLMITYIDDNGFLYIKPVGGVDLGILPARKITIKHGEEDVIGIIGRKPIHLMRDEANNVKVSCDDLWVDVGAKNRAEALEMVNIGDYAYFCSDYEEFPNELIAGAYFDDKIGLNVLLRLAEQLNDINAPWDIYFVASNYEEIGLRGAIVAANSIHPDVCVCIDTTHATDYPSMNVISHGDIKLGEGCVLAKGPNIFPKLVVVLENIARDNNIKYQVEVSPYQTGTDANVIQISNNGVMTSLISIPCRYLHTPYEMCSKNDMESAIEILGKFIRNDFN